MIVISILGRHFPTTSTLTNGKDAAGLGLRGGKAPTALSTSGTRRGYLQEWDCPMNSLRLTGCFLPLMAVVESASRLSAGGAVFGLRRRLSRD